MEKLFPITINSELCVRCQKCTYSCPPKAIFFRDSLRYVDFNKCKGCLKCVDVCEHNAIEVISMEEGELIDFKIEAKKCTLCQKCLDIDFCFQDLFLLDINDKTGEKAISFDKKKISKCKSCLKCVINCPNNAIKPIIVSNDEKNEGVELKK